MDRYILLEIFALCCVHSMAETPKHTYEYCWRDYDGTIPPDALPANGPNRNGKTIYIGQALHEDKLIPGKLFENINQLYFEKSGVEHSTDANVKILCSDHPNKFEWVTTRQLDADRLPNKILITGGFEPNCSTYIGRVPTTEGLTPGKVMCCNAADHCYGLYTTYFGNGTLHENFEILTYNQNAPSSGSNRGANTKKCRQTTINVFI